MIFFDEFHIFFTSWAFVEPFGSSSEELGNYHQTPTLIGCMFLMISWLQTTRKTGQSSSSCKTRCDQRSLVFYNAFCAFSKRLCSFLEKTPNPRIGRFRRREPDDDLLSHGNPHYHWRRVVSLSCSGWEGVGPTRYGRQAKLFCHLDTKVKTTNL